MRELGRQVAAQRRCLSVAKVNSEQPAQSIPADEAEPALLARLRQMLLPPAAVEGAREELRRRLTLPSRGAADDARARLETRLSRLKTQFEWGDISEAEYRAKMEETRAHLALPRDGQGGHLRPGCRGRRIARRGHR